MRTVLFFVGSALGSLAFQLTVALYPQKLQNYKSLVPWVWGAWAVIWIIWLIYLAFERSGSKKQPSLPAPTPSPSSTEAKATIAPIISPVIAPVFNTGYGPVAPPSQEIPKPDETSPVTVEFAPWEGQFDKMFLTITNRGAKQIFHAQCRILERRNDPNPPHRMTLDLQWQSGSSEKLLIPGDSGNLLIASAGEDRSSAMEWMKIEGATGHHGPDSRWEPTEKKRPEYDLEITVLGDKSAQPQSEQFTLRAGTTRALEMFRRYLEITAPKNGAEVGYRHDVVGTVSPPDATVQVFLYAGNFWHHQGAVTAQRSTWSIKCWFGEQDTPLGGEYLIRAIANGNIQGKELLALPEVGTRSGIIRVRRTLN